MYGSYMQRAFSIFYFLKFEFHIKYYHSLEQTICAEISLHM